MDMMDFISVLLCQTDLITVTYLGVIKNPFLASRSMHLSETLFQITCDGDLARTVDDNF